MVIFIQLIIKQIHSAYLESKPFSLAFLFFKLVFSLQNCMIIVFLLSGSVLNLFEFMILEETTKKLCFGLHTILK